MRNTLFILALCVVAILLGLFLFFYNPKDLTGQKGTDQSAQVGTATVTVTPVVFTVLETGGNALEGDGDRKNIAARDQESFDRVWKMAHGAQEIAAPEIDFSKEYIVAVFAGQKPSGGHAIAVTKVEDVGDERVITVTLTAPGANCVVTDMLTSPYQLIRVPASMHYLKAVDTTVTTPCE
jgi:hypothetical protein